MVLEFNGAVVTLTTTVLKPIQPITMLAKPFQCVTKRLAVLN